MIVALKRHFSLFRKANSGNIAITFAAALIPIVMVVGGAVDYSNAKSMQAGLQNTLDSATLAGARALANSEDVEQAVSKYLHGSWPESVALPDYSVEVNDKNVTVAFSTPPVVKTKVLSMFGWGDMSAGVKSVATISAPTMDIALAMDNSSSMKSKLGMLSSEGNNFLDRIEQANQGVDPHQMNWVSIVTFDRGIAQTYSLTMNIAGLHYVIGQMRAKDNTAMGMGIREAWKWLQQSPRRFPTPGYAQATDSKYQYLVLMSDGDEDKMGGITSADVCPAVRASGVKLIVIGFPPEHGSKDTDRLVACAGGLTNAHWATGQALTKVFDDIIRENSQPRLTQ